MPLTLASADMNDYLKGSEIIDFDRDVEVKRLAAKLMGENSSEPGFIKSAYEYVRDRIKHPIYVDTP